MVSTDRAGVEAVAPAAVGRAARPARRARSSRSSTVTRRPAPASRSAADSPPRPAPTTTTWSARARVTVRDRAMPLGSPDRAAVRRASTSVGEHLGAPGGSRRPATSAACAACSPARRSSARPRRGRRCRSITSRSAADAVGVQVGVDRGAVAAARAPGRGSARCWASATRTVRLPSRRSSPAGLPVSAGSPNTPSTSSRSWNASPSGSPYAE